MLVIGIAGGSGSGKTTVVKAISDNLKGEKVVIIPQPPKGTTGTQSQSEQPVDQTNSGTPEGENAKPEEAEHTTDPA